MNQASQIADVNNAWFFEMGKFSHNFYEHENNVFVHLHVYHC